MKAYTSTLGLLNHSHTHLRIMLLYTILNLSPISELFNEWKTKIKSQYHLPTNAPKTNRIQLNIQASIAVKPRKNGL